MRFSVFFAAAVSSMLNTSCSSTSQAVSRPEPDAPPPVAVARAMPDAMKRQVVVTGEFRPYRVIDIHAKAAGYMKRIYVDIGDRVKAAQLLAKLEIPGMKNELAQAAAGHRRSSAEPMRAKGELERAEAHRAVVEVSYSRLLSVTKTAQREIQPRLLTRQNSSCRRSKEKLS